jgi:ribonuclease III
MISEIEKIKLIENRIGYVFKDKSNLVQAFVTKSYAKEKKDKGIVCMSQESYRTYGDVILKRILVELVKKNGYETPQEITDAKKELENQVKLAEIFSSFNIPPDHFLLGNGETVSRRLRAETFEALICAMFLDITSKSDEKIANSQLQDYISKWFEPHICQKNKINKT